MDKWDIIFMESKPFVEATKEFFRVVVLAMIPVAIDGLIQSTIDFRLMAITGIIAGLRFLDKFLHELGKQNSTDTEQSNLIKGLTRF